MSALKILENVEIELDRIRKTASRLDDELILYLIDMTILAVKRKAIGESAEFTPLRARTPSQHRDLPRR
ncbi:MAG TPA: hypothetical protein VJY34_17260 [Roseiarcus sp.]|nr:hypothetical protein [Roseiarcus sp.]